MFKLNKSKTSWDRIVPNNSLPTPVKNALRWFVDPYEPNTIYVLDQDGVKVFVDGGGPLGSRCSLHARGHSR